jgi:DNA helicase II / ATP-dependent DNA helicase PcrA
VGDVIEVSYTGDLLAHRRCPRSWCYEKYAGFHPYEQVQAMEGRLIHHAMEWLARTYREKGSHSSVSELRSQLEKYFRVLWARGFRTTFASKADTLDRVQGNLFPNGKLDVVVRSAIEGAVHTEYEIRAVKRLIQADFAGKSRMLLTGIIDIVIQQQQPLTYRRVWQWASTNELTGQVAKLDLPAKSNDLEIWDYKGTRANTPYKEDYVRQLLTYASLYRERTGVLPQRCVLFFVNEQNASERLVAIPIDAKIVERGVEWTVDQVKELRRTTLLFESNPTAVEGGSVHLLHKPVGSRTDGELSKQCTACGFRFDCKEYGAHLGKVDHPDIRLDNVQKN